MSFGLRNCIFLNIRSLCIVYITLGMAQSVVSFNMSNIELMPILCMTGSQQQSTICEIGKYQGIIFACELKYAKLYLGI